MLPFQSNPDKRQFQCFCCGFLFPEYKEFKEHILQDHEEGREYVVCPVKYCAAPCRDLHSHFTNKHPSLKLPDGIQHRASVWYDFRKPSKRKKIPSFKEGTIISTKNGGKVLHYRSGYEYDVYMHLETRADVVAYEVEPFPVSYFFRSKNRNYYPDLRILFTDGRIEVWEVKPENQTNMQQNKAKWAACRLYCESRGWEFDVITETDISAMKRRK